MVFLDNAATTWHKPPSVYQAVQSAMRECASVGRGGYSAAAVASRRVFECREQLASLFNMKDPARVMFTYNATVALNMAIKGLADRGHVLTTGYEHNAVVRPLEALAHIGVTWSAAESPLFEPETMLKTMERNLRLDTVLVVANHVSNVFGFIAPVYEIDEMCSRHGLPLVIDASQSAGTVQLDASRLKAAEFICMPGHKSLYGPQGTGVMLHIGGLPCSTILEGGTGSESASYDQPVFEPDRFESGTHNVAGIAGLCEGVRFVAESGPENILKHERELTGYASRELSKLKGVNVFMSRRPEYQAAVMSFTVDGWECEDLAAALSSAGIAVRAGLHCAPLAHHTAGTFPGGTVRVSPGAFNTTMDIEKLIMSVRAVIR